MKFTNYRARQKLFAIRNDLRKSDKYKYIYINEDMTFRRGKLLFNARKLVHESAACRSDGKIFIKDNKGEKHFITTQEQITLLSTTDLRPESDDENDS